MAAKNARRGNIFDEDTTSVYDLDLPEHRSDAYDVEVVTILNDDEEYMLDVFHQQYVAVQARSATGRLVNTRIGEMGSHASVAMARMMQDVERVEDAVHLNRLEKRLQEFDNRVVDLTTKQALATNSVIVHTIHEDLRRNVYKPPPPAPQRRKGLIPSAVEFLFGER